MGHGRAKGLVQLTGKTLAVFVVRKAIVKEITSCDPKYRYYSYTGRTGLL